MSQVRLTKEEFIAKARTIHVDKYDYSLAEIRGNSKSKVTIKCSTCGLVFEQRIEHHLYGCVCPDCAKEKAKETLSDTKEEFIAKATMAHGGKYTYDNVIYINNHTPVLITCPVHGDFPQAQSSHKSGQGCPKCSASHLETQARNILDENNIKYDTEKTFPWLKNKREMPLDFYLLDYNVAIECQWIQHYEAMGIFTKERVLYTKQMTISNMNFVKNMEFLFIISNMMKMLKKE